MTGVCLKHSYYSSSSFPSGSSVSTEGYFEREDTQDQKEGNRKIMSGPTREDDEAKHEAARAPLTPGEAPKREHLTLDARRVRLRPVRPDEDLHELYAASHPPHMGTSSLPPQYIFIHPITIKLRKFRPFSHVTFHLRINSKKM